MAQRYYVLPMEKIGNGRGPKYFSWQRDIVIGIVAPWSLQQYGFEDLCLIAADIQQSDHDDLVLNADVFAFPDTLDTNIGNEAATALDALLESFNVPADWTNPSVSSRESIRAITNMFFFNQRMSGLLGNLSIFENNDLNAKFLSLPQNIRGAFLLASSELNISVNFDIDPTLRQIFRQAETDFQALPVTYLGISI